jgi:hypothetical protein
MGASKTFNKVVNTGILGLPGTVLRKQRLASERKGRAEGIAREQARSKEEIARQKAIADESVRKQKEKARRQLIFAGNAQNNLFSPTLGGVGGQQTLG